MCAVETMQDRRVFSDDNPDGASLRGKGMRLAGTSDCTRSRARGPSCGGRRDKGTFEESRVLLAIGGGV